MFGSKIEKTSKPDSLDQFEEIVIGNKLKDIIRSKLKEFLPPKKVDLLLKKKSLIFKNAFEELVDHLINMQDGYLTTDWNYTLKEIGAVMKSDLYHPYHKVFERLKQPKYLEEHLKSHNKLYVLYSEKRDFTKEKLTESDFDPFLLTLPTRHDQEPILQISLVVGIWYVEFNETGIVIPKKLSNELLKFIQKDIKPYKIDKTFDEIANILIKMSFEYNKLEFSKEHNSYHFMFDLMSALLGKVPDFSYSEARLQNTIRLQGSSLLTYECQPDIKFLEKFNIKKKHQFDNHREFDHFLNTKIFQVDPDFKKNYPEDFELFTKFEKFYKFRHMKGEDDACVPSQNCPLKDHWNM